MRVEVTAECITRFRPPRARKDRFRTDKRTFRTGVPEVTACEAPVAIRQRGYCPHGFCKSDLEGNQVVEYRWWNQRLWARPVLSRFVVTAEVRYATLADVVTYSRSYAYHPGVSRQKRQALIKKHFDRFLLVDGDLYEHIGEPRYVVMTFGLGHNHGGTALTTDTSFNGNLHRNRYFRIDERPRAVAEAERTAQARGDTRNVPIEPQAEFEVLIPEAVRLNPKTHGTGDPFLNKLYAASESGAPPLAVALFGPGEAFRDP